MSAEEQLSERLPAVLGAALGLDIADITIDNLRPLKRTLNRATWAFDAVTPYGRRPLMLQHTTSPTPMGAGMGLQAHARAAAAARGVPIARIVAADDSADALGKPFLISEMVMGETDYFDIVGQLDSADGQAGRARLLRQCALALAAIHRVSYDPDGPRQDQLGICRRALDDPGDPSATFEWAFRWLAAHQPPPSPPVLVHGDYRMGNLLVDGSDLTSVLDWDLVHVGEAYEDLACFCIRAWRYGAPASLGAGGLGSIEDFLCAYEQASGTSVDRAGFHWWRVLSTLIWGLTCRGQAQTWLTEKLYSMHYAIMGRRVCEAEWDLLNLLGGAQPGDDAGRGRPEEEPGNQTQPGDDAGRGRPEEEPGNQTQPGDDAGRGRPEEEPGNQTQPGDDAGRGRPEKEPGNQTQPGDDAGRGRPEEEPGNQTQPGDDAGQVAARAGGTTGSRRTGQSDPAVTAALYGRPTAAELLAAVAEFLETLGSANRDAKAEMTAAADVLRIVERELLEDSADDAGPAQTARVGGALTISSKPRRDRPTAAEAVAAVAEFLETTIRSAVSPKRNARTTVSATANTLRTVERELLMGSADEVTQALAAVGFVDEAQLAVAIRNGDLDYRADDVTSCLRALVIHRLAVAHPGYQNE